MVFALEIIRGASMRVYLSLALSFLAIVTAWAQSERSLVREGNRAYESNKFPDAEVNYRKAVEKNKEFREGPFNLGDALYKQERYGEAAEQYTIAAARTKDAEGKAHALHNLGNSLLKTQKYPESIAAYKEALKINPSDGDTKYNLEYARRMLQQQQQKNKDQKDDKQKQEKKDQQKQDQQKQEEQKQDQQKQEQRKNDKDEQQQAQQKKQQISKQDAERILEALKNEERDVQKKLHRKVPARVKVEKDW